MTDSTNNALADPRVKALVDALSETTEALAKQIGQRRHAAWVLIRNNRAALAALEGGKDE